MVVSSPPPNPPEIIVVEDEVPGTSITLVVEGLRAGSRNPLHGTAPSLVGGGGPVPLAVQIRALKSPLLLLLDSPVAYLFPPPLTMPPHPFIGGVEGEG